MLLLRTIDSSPMHEHTEMEHRNVSVAGTGSRGVGSYATVVTKPRANVVCIRPAGWLTGVDVSAVCNARTQCDLACKPQQCDISM